jgi:hypothetical protein
MDLVETHGFDHAGIVGCEKGVDLQTGAFLHGIQERLPGGFQVGGGLGRNNTEVDFLSFLRPGRPLKDNAHQRPARQP